MHQPVSHHLVLSFKTFPTKSTGTSFDGTKVRSILRVYIGVRAESGEGFPVRTKGMTFPVDNGDLGAR